MFVIFEYKPTNREIREALAIYSRSAGSAGSAGGDAADAAAASAGGDAADAAATIEHMNLFAFTICFRITFRFKIEGRGMGCVSFTAILDKESMKQNKQPAVLFNYNEFLAALTCPSSTFFTKINELIWGMGLGLLPVSVNAEWLKSRFITQGRAVVLLNGCTRILMFNDNTFKWSHPDADVNLTPPFGFKLNLYGNAPATPEDIRKHYPEYLGPLGGDGDLRYFQGVLHKGDYSNPDVGGGDEDEDVDVNISIPRGNAVTFDSSNGVKNVKLESIGVVAKIPPRWAGLSILDPNIFNEFIEHDKGDWFNSQDIDGSPSIDRFDVFDSVEKSIEKSITSSVQRSIASSRECSDGGDVVLESQKEFVESLNTYDPLNTNEVSSIGFGNTLKQAVMRIFNKAKTFVNKVFGFGPGPVSGAAVSVERSGGPDGAPPSKRASIGGKHKRISKKTMKKYKKRCSVRGRSRGRSRGRIHRRTIKKLK